MPSPAVIGSQAGTLDWPRLLGFVAATFSSASLTILVLI